MSNVLERIQAKKENGNNSNTTRTISTNVLERIENRKHQEKIRQEQENAEKETKRQEAQKSLVGKTVTLSNGKSYTITQEDIEKGNALANTTSLSGEQTRKNNSGLTNLRNDVSSFFRGINDGIDTVLESGYSSVGNATVDTVYGLKDIFTKEDNVEEYLKEKDRVKYNWGITNAQKEAERLKKISNVNNVLGTGAEILGSMVPMVTIGAATYGTGVLPTVALQTKGGKTEEFLRSDDAKTVNEAELKSLPYAGISAGVEALTGIGKAGKLFSGTVRRSSLGEGVEELIEGVGSNVLDRVLMKNKMQDAPIYSTTDQRALINPVEMTKQFAGGMFGGYTFGSINRAMINGTINSDLITCQEAVNNAKENVSKLTKKDTEKMYQLKTELETIKNNPDIELTKNTLNNINNTLKTIEEIDTKLNPKTEEVIENTNSNSKNDVAIDINLKDIEYNQDLKNMINNLVQEKGYNNSDFKASLSTKITEKQNLNKEFMNKLGVDVVYFNGNMPISEFVVGNKLYVRSNQEVSDDWAIGHGFVHNLRNNHPELYTELTNVISQTNLTTMQEKYLHNQAENETYYNQLAQNKDLLTEEAIADFSGDIFNKVDVWEKINQKDPNLFQKIVNYFKNFFDTIRGRVDEVEYRKFENKLSDIIKRVNKLDVQLENNANSANKIKYDILTNSKGTYVKADRKVISGEDSNEWGKQVTNYINEKIRNNEDVKVKAIDGDILTITADTSGKAAFRNTIKDKDGNERLMTDKEFEAKLNAEAHIDELAQISVRGKYDIPDTKNHSFAKDGFNYRSAFFEDFDGKYYKIIMSVGKNGEINTIYNVGRMFERKKGAEIIGSSVKNGARTAPFDDIILQDNQNMQENNENSLKDNLGNELSEGQQEKFKNSKIRDSKGRLKVMYHGTPIGNFTIFKKYQYFTDIKEYADTYQNPVASSNYAPEKYSSEKNPKTYEVYLNVEKPFDLNNAEDRKIFIEEYVKGGNAQGINPYLQDYSDITKIDWTEGDNLVEFLEENYPEYDGIIINEGGNENGTTRGMSVVVFNPNQIKNIDNTNPTKSDDIRFSINGNESKYSQRTDEEEKIVSANKQKFIDSNPTPNIFESITQKYSINDNNKNKLPEDNVFKKVADNAKQKEQEKQYQDSTNIRRTIESAKKSTMVTTDVSKNLESQEYTVKHNVDSIGNARKFLKDKYGDNIEKATSDFMNNQMEHSSEILDNAILVELFRQNNNKGNTELTVALTERVAELQTQRGQEIQILSLLNRMTPEGQIMFLERQINKINDDIDKNNKVLKDKNKKEKYTDKKIEFSTEEKQQIYERFKAISEMNENDKNALKKFILDNTTAKGYFKKKAENAIYQMELSLDQLKERALATIYQRVYNKVESSIGDKINTYQTMSHLINFKTAFRNMISNKVMIAQEGISQSMSKVVDNMISSKTGVKAFSGKKLTKEQWKEIKAKQKYKGDLIALDIALGIDKQIDGFDKYRDAVIRNGQIQSLEKIKANNYTFQNGTLNFAEKVLANELQVPDERAKEYVRQKFIEEQKNLIREELEKSGHKNITEADIESRITEDMLEEADELARYQTFQDDAWVSSFLIKTKKLLNNVGIDGFGLGDLMVKYAKTPGNIITRTIEYSPVGAIKGLVGMKNVFDSAKSGKITARQQRQALMTLSRGMTGSVLYALGMALCEMGILTTENPNEDKEMQRLLNDAGLSGSKINVSALLRSIVGKDTDIQDGDFLMSFDWLQPTGTTIMQGATLMSGLKNNDWSQGVTNNMMNVLGIGVQSLKTGIDVPMMSTISAMVNQIMYKKEDESGWEVFFVPFTENVSGFIPAPVRQIANILDVKGRQTYDKNIFKKAAKKTINNIPVARNLLLEETKRVDGTTKEYDLGNLLLNVANQVLPFNTTKYNPVEGTTTLKKLQNTLDENGHLPRTYAENSIKVNGEKVILNDKQKNAYMEGYSEVYREQYLPLLNKYKEADNLTQYQKEMIQAMLENINKSAKKAGQRKVKEMLNE